MSDFDLLVSYFKEQNVNSEAIFIRQAYPGPFYWKSFDNGKIKIFKKGQITKVYVYPTFKLFY